MTREELKSAAIAAHRRGDLWGDFYGDVGSSIRAAEPFNGRRYHKLVDHLLCLIVSGDTIGHHPIDPDAEPAWEVDDAAEALDQPGPSDTATAARLQPHALPAGGPPPRSRVLPNGAAR